VEGRGERMQTCPQPRDTKRSLAASAFPSQELGNEGNSLV
jgi:hypothetical protein